MEVDQHPLDAAPSLLVGNELLKFPEDDCNNTSALTSVVLSFSETPRISADKVATVGDSGDCKLDVVGNCTDGGIIHLIQSSRLRILSPCASTTEEDRTASNIS